MNCAFCKIEIVWDSIYCDQCGMEIFLCAKCGKAGKGKICIYDGTKLESAKTIQGPVLSVPQQGIQPQPAFSDKIPQIAVSIKIPELSLINRNLGMLLKIEPGDILGRASGRFTDLFHQYRWVSGKHLEFAYDSAKGWIVKDLASKNGAKYKNVKLIPNEPVVLSDNTFLLMGKIEFFVQIRDLEKHTATETIRVN